MTELLLRTDTGHVATLTLNRPHKLNALSEAMLSALQNQLDALRDDRNIRAIILRGAGKAFCAGHDLREMTDARQAEDAGKGYFNALFAQCSKVMLSITHLPQPVIAQVHGIATAAGCQLAATCDMAVAEGHTRFGVNGVNIGLFCSTPMVALSRNIPRKVAFEMLTTGEFISAAKAREFGLVNRVASADELDVTTMDLAQKVAGKLAAAVKVGKRAFYEQLEMGLADAYAHTGAVMADNMMLHDTAEGVSAFLEKRKPDWS